MLRFAIPGGWWPLEVGAPVGRCLVMKLVC